MFGSSSDFFSWYQSQTFISINVQTSHKPTGISSQLAMSMLAAITKTLVNLWNNSFMRSWEEECFSQVKWIGLDIIHCHWLCPQVTR
jgi:hypothetical protein